MEKRKLLIRSRYLVYGAVFVFLYVLQCMPGFLEIGGVRPILLIPAAVTLAMFEGEFVGGLYGALAGLLCGLSSSMVFGFDGLLLLCFCVASGLLVIYLLRRTLMTAYLLVGVSVALRCRLAYFFSYGIWGYEDGGDIFWRSTVWMIFYTSLLTPVFFKMWEVICGYYSSLVSTNVLKLRE